MSASVDAAGTAAVRPASAWHVSPAIDALAYHWSWLYILVPLLVLSQYGGAQAPAGTWAATGWFVVWSVGMTIGFLHRHFTMPYVYLDRQVFAQHAPRFIVAPAWLVAGFLATPLGWRWKVPAGFFGYADVTALVALLLAGFAAWSTDRSDRASPRHWVSWAPIAVLPFVPLLGAWSHHHPTAIVATLVASTLAISALQGASSGLSLLSFVLALGGMTLLAPDAPALAHPPFGFRTAIMVVAIASGAWNVWHVYMQKFGILRMYAAKSPAPPEARPPAWVDRLFVFGFVPLTAVVVASSAGVLLQRHYPSAVPLLAPLVAALLTARIALLPLSAAIAVASLAVWVHHELRAHGTSQPARWSMALGTTGLNAAFLIAPADLAYIAYGFSHAIEYMVFVWAFQRKRYAAPLPHDPLLGRLLQHPWLAYGALIAVVAGLGFWLDFGDDLGLAPKPFVILGTKAGSWLFFWTIWHSFAHFYFDGFLWKMRLPQVRQSL